MKHPALPTLDPSLIFPRPPFRIEESLLESPTLDSAAAAYLQQIRDWRQTVLAFVCGPDPTAPHGLSQRARRTLETFFALSWSDAMTRYAIQSPYNLMAFPTPALKSTPATNIQTVLQVLRWRAGVTDYLDDVWDVVNEPSLDMDECTAIDRFLGCASDEPVCHLCLTEFAKDRVHPDLHACLLLRHVRAKWPVIPIFEQWKDEAARAQET
jgi:hypothetical protein